MEKRKINTQEEYKAIDFYSNRNFEIGDALTLKK